MSIQLSVVIPARVKDNHLNRVVASVKKQKNINLEILVVFNPFLPAWSQKGVRILSSAEGANCARNVGLKNSNADLVYFLDSDCELENELSLSERYEVMNTHKNWVAAGGTYDVLQGANAPTKAYNYIQNEWLNSNLQNTDFKAAFLIGGNMMLRKSLLQGIKFDENIKFGGTEKEFFCRLQILNSNIYLLPDWPVLHLAELNAQQLELKARHQAEGSRYIEQKGVQFRPIKKNIFVEPPPRNLLKEIESYHQEYNRVYVGANRLKESAHDRFKKMISKMVDSIDITIQNIKNSQSNNP